MKMFNDYVLIDPDDHSKTSGGLYVPETAKKRVKTGRVMAVAELPEDEAYKMPSVGDVVMYDALGGLEPIEVAEGDEKKKYDLVMLRQVIMSTGKPSEA